MKRPFIKLLCFLPLGIALCSVPAYASPIAFLETVTGSGSLAGTSFTNQLVTLKGTADTADVTSSGSNYFLRLSSATVQIGTGGTATFSDSIEVFDNQMQGNAGFEEIGRADILDTVSSVFSTWALQTPVVTSGATVFNIGSPFATSLGAFSMSSTTGSATFSAAGAAVAATPEPSTMTMVGTGLVGLAGLVRRRFVRA